MDGRDAVRAVRADDRQIRHPDLAGRRLLDQAHPRSLCLVSGVRRTDGIQESPVDLVDDLQLPGEEGFEQFDRPLLQGLRQERVVRVGQRANGDVPRLVPTEFRPIEQDAHQLGHRHRRVGIVELDRDLFRKRRPVVPAAQEPGHDVGQRAGDQEVFLDKPQRSASGRGVVRIEDAADRLREHPVRYRAEEIAAAELAEIENVRGCGLPQAECVDRPSPITDHGPVVRDPEQMHGLATVHRDRAPVGFEPGAERHLDRLVLRGTSHGSGRLNQWSGCSTCEPSRISWRKIP